jgi:hypothetical protein
MFGEPRCKVKVKQFFDCQLCDKKSDRKLPFSKRCRRSSCDGMNASILFGIALVAACALVWGGMRLMRVPADRTRGMLMIVMAVVIVGNVLIWAVPV